jgi:hypothetical protein
MVNNPTYGCIRGNYSGLGTVYNGYTYFITNDKESAFVMTQGINVLTFFIWREKRKK